MYHHLENGFDERLDYQTLAEAEQAAQKYVAGTMEGEDGFAYDGAGIYDLQENRWLRVYGNFPDERAIEQTEQALAGEQQKKDGPAIAEVDKPAPYEELVGKEVTLDGHRFMVERVSDLSDDVTLRDLTFEGNVGFPISRIEKVTRVRRLLQEQEEAQPQKKNRLRCRKSAPAVSALPSRLCTRRSPGTSAMIFTSPMTPWAMAPPARNTRPMLPPSAR